MPQQEYVTLNVLASEMGMDKSNTRKYILKQGFTFAKVRTPESKGQLTLALTAEDAQTVLELRRSQGFEKGQMQPVDSENGYFYIIQLIPEFSSRRVKLGFAADVAGRLAAHRTSAPTALLVKSWPCKRSWEAVAITSVTREQCTLVANEVYDCEDIDALVNRTDTFFGIMPAP